MGNCHGKQVEGQGETKQEMKNEDPPSAAGTPRKDSFQSHNPSPTSSSRRYSPSNSSPSSTPLRVFKRAFPPASPAKHIKAFLARRHGTAKPADTSVPATELVLDKNFGYSKQFASTYEIGEEVGRGHFGYTTRAKAKKGGNKGQEMAVKVIPKAKMSTAIAIEDVRREVRILSALAVHKNLVKFQEAYEDENYVYIVMELCEGGELLDRILSRGGKFKESDAKRIIVQILSVVSLCHLQGVLHRDLKPENFLFASKDEASPLKAIDFGLSDFVKPDERLNDIVGSAYYVAPEVLHRSYGTEADMWSIGVITYILLCGMRPFWARTESGIFRAVLKGDASFEDEPWPSLSSEAKDFVRSLLTKDYRRRMTATQALCHPWLLSENQETTVPFDILIFKLVKDYLSSSCLRRSALRALAKTLTASQLSYLKLQFALLGPNKNGFITMKNFKKALPKTSAATKDSGVFDYVNMVSNMPYGKLDFEEFSAAVMSVHQLEGLDSWQERANNAYGLFDRVDNRTIMIEELTLELGLGPSVPVYTVLRDWVRLADGKLTFMGFIKLLHAPPMQQKT